MGNYFNELRWKIIRANNLLLFIHQVTIEFRFRKSLAQERFKSNLEFIYQIIVSSIEFRKGFVKFMIMHLRFPNKIKTDITYTALKTVAWHTEQQRRWSGCIIEQLWSGHKFIVLQ